MSILRKMAFPGAELIRIIYMQAVYQSLLHLGWIDKLLDNISTIFIDLYKDQLSSTRARIIEYPFDKYFDQQVQELEDNTGAVAEPLVADAEIKKDPFVSSDNGGPPPPLPGLIQGMRILLLCAANINTDYVKRSVKLRRAW